MNEGIPAYAESRTGYFNTIEVETMLSLLSVIDNPMQDIPLAAVLKSPIVGMTDEELAELMAEYKGCADWAVPYLFDGERLYDTLILAPPGAGKTTLLRDLLRQISNSTDGKGVAILDQRYEIAACHRGVPMNDVGLHSDVYYG